MLKAVLLSLLFFCSHASAQMPLITKVNTPGFMLPSAVSIQTCYVFFDRVVIRDQMNYGGGPTDSQPKPVVMTRVIPISLTPNILEMISYANAEQLTTTPNHMCDGPSTKITASSPTSGNFLLFQTGGCSTPRSERSGSNSWHLREIIDQFCPLTHDPQANGGARQLR